MPGTSVFRDVVYCTLSRLRQIHFFLHSKYSFLRPFRVSFIPLNGFIAHAIGIHSVPICFSNFVCCFYVAADPRTDFETSLPIASLCVLLAVLVIVLENNSAVAFRQLQTQLAAKVRLLDTTTDGYCSIRGETGSVRSVVDGLMMARLVEE